MTIKSAVQPVLDDYLKAYRNNDDGALPPFSNYNEAKVMKQSVLFVCTGNSARSQMAEALLRHQATKYYDVYSAGTNPQTVDERAILALTKFGIDASSLHEKALSDLATNQFDFVISLCDKAQHECQQVTTGRQYLSWDFEDPKTRGGAKPFETTLKELDQRIKMFILINAK